MFKHDKALLREVKVERPSIFFAKGYPYYTYNKAINKNLFITNANYYTFFFKQNSFFKENKSFNFFFEKRILFKKKIKKFNNWLITNYLF